MEDYEFVALQDQLIIESDRFSEEKELFNSFNNPNLVNYGTRKGMFRTLLPNYRAIRSSNRTRNPSGMSIYSRMHSTRNQSSYAYKSPKNGKYDSTTREERLPKLWGDQ